MEAFLVAPSSQAVDAMKDLITVQQKQVDTANHAAESWYDAMIHAEGQMWERFAEQEAEKVCLVEKVYGWLARGNDMALLRSFLSDEELAKLVPMLESEVKRVNSVLNSPSHPTDPSKTISFERLSVLKRMLVSLDAEA